MKKILLFGFTLFNLFVLCSQNKIDKTVLNNPLKWRNEIVDFPVDFAPDFKLKGFEELLFSPEWGKPNTDGFWSLVMAWKITHSKTLSLVEIENNFKTYFKGLMTNNQSEKDFPEPKVIFNLKSSKRNAFYFEGSMELYDGFFTRKIIKLNIKGEQFRLKQQQQNIVMFRISPQNFNHKLWKDLFTISIKK